MSQAPSNKTVLNDRTLWFDGDSTVDESLVMSSIINNKDISSFCVESLSAEIIRYNKLMPHNEQIMVKTNNPKFSFDWNIPDEYKNMNVVSLVADKHFEIMGNEPDLLDRELRCAKELKLYYKYELMDTLKALIYIINILVEKNIVWGVGRGSSVSSYVLYILGVHDVDSYHYNLDIEEFLRDPKT